MNFENLNLIRPLTEALSKKGYLEPTPIQEKAIPFILEGKDVFGCAQTGTGKTAAFALPLLQLIENDKKSTTPKGIQALILAPTRELALQIGQSFSEYGSSLRLKQVTIFGGVSQFHQEKAIKKGVDILIATPGRLLDLLQQRIISIHEVKHFVLDEADRMLDMGFIHDIRKIIGKLPQKRQNLFFSATVSPDVRKLADTILRNPVSVSVTPVSSPAVLVKQFVYYVSRENKRQLLRFVLKNPSIDNALVFTRTKRGADKVAKELQRSGINAEAIHGNKSQNARERALNGFKNHKIRVLVATDIASRGIDVEKLSHVINFELPELPETYVHRIGRTGRAGAAGTALSFCTSDEVAYLKNINRLIRKNIDVVETHPFA